MVVNHPPRAARRQALGGEALVGADAAPSARDWRSRAMPSLKDLKIRIASVKSTRKITKAMQMVAAAKLRRAQEAAEAARPYAERMEAVLGNLAAGVAASPSAPRLLGGTGTLGHPPAGRRHRRARPLRRLQLLDRPARARPRHPAARRGQDRQDPDRRQEGPRAAAPRPRPAARRPRRPRPGPQARLRRRRRDRPRHAAPLRCRRVRRLHASSTTASSR